MENLQEINLTELNVQEMTETDGGYMIELLVCAAALGGALYGAGYACGKAYYYFSN